MRAVVLGGGSWGTTIGSLVAENTDALIWCRNEEVAEDINQNHRNERYLSDLPLHPSLKATTDLQEAMLDGEVVIVGVPSHNFRSVLEQIKGLVAESSPIVSLAKGLEKNSNLRMSQVIEEVLPNNPLCVLTGPNLAREILSGYATASVAASHSLEVAGMVQKIIAVPTFRIYTNRDVVGSELGGALKNVVALGAGIGQGLGLGDNTRATVLTRGLAEVTRLGVAMGGKPETFSGLAGMGDLVATSISRHSRNRFVGEELGKGKPLDEIIRNMDQVSEGVHTSSVVMELAREHNVEMPISQAVHLIISGICTPEEAYEELLKREARPELDFWAF